MTRTRILFIIVLLLIASVTSYFTFDMLQPDTNNHINNPHDPDQIAVNATLTQMNKNGTIAHAVSTPRLEHYPYQDSTSFVKPDINIMNKSQNPWHITADRGTSQQGSTTIQLINNVKLHQATGPNNTELTITTSAVTIYAKEKHIITDQPVTIIKPGTIIKAVGAEAYVNSKIVNLLSNVREKHVPNNKKTIYLNSDQASYNRKTHVSTYTGKVKFSQETSHLTADKLVIYDNKKNNKIYKMVAFGNRAHYSTLPEGKQDVIHAKANTITYYLQKNTAVLTGNAEVTQKGNRMRGPHIVYNTKRNTVLLNLSTKNQARITFQP